jgi:sugar lactone lactonase YvrE
MALVCCCAVPLWSAEKLVLVAGGGSGAPGSPAAQAAIGQPFGVDIDAQGNLFIADFTEHRVWKVDAAGILSIVGGNGKKAFAGDGGPATEGSFDSMHDLVLDSEGNIYIADSNNLRVRKIDAKTGVLSTVAGNGKKGVSGDGGPGTEASLDGVASLFFNSDRSKLYLTGFSSVVRILDMKTGIIETIKGFPGGRSVAVDSHGNVYVGGGTTLRVRRPDGTVETLIDKKTAPAGSLTIGDNTKHLGFDAEENVLLADDFGHALKKYLVAEKKLVPLVGSGVRGTQGLNGPPLAAELNGPHGVYFHPASKTLYVCDSRNRRVLKVVNDNN